MPDIQKIFSDIYDKYVDKIYRFIVLKVNSNETAQDLTSEVFLRGWEALKSQKQIDNIPAFLYQIARNLIVDHYREKGQVQLVSTELGEITDSKPNPAEESYSRSEIDQIKAALVNINEDYRDVIMWYYLDDLSVPEIAKITNKSEGAVRVMIHRALEQLRQVLEPLE